MKAYRIEITDRDGVTCTYETRATHIYAALTDVEWFAENYGHTLDMGVKVEVNELVHKRE